MNPTNDETATLPLADTSEAIPSFRPEALFATGHAHAAGGPRRRGRPLEMTKDEVCAEIRRLAAIERGLVAIHRRNPGLYARARRQFGSWAAAVREARG
jgi:hypothetical protein